MLFQYLCVCIYPLHTLLDVNANVDQKTDQNATALFFVAREGHAKCVYATLLSQCSDSL
jgi:hypothetical protein